MKLSQVLNHPIVALVRRALAELAGGLGFTWLALLLLEVIRPTLVSAYLNLNQLLVVCVLLWLAGTPAQPPSRRPYAAAATFAILVAGVSLVATPGSAAAWFPPLAGLTAFGLILAATSASWRTPTSN